MLKNPFWNSENDSCNIGNTSIKRILDLENTPFAADLVFPDANTEIINKLSEQVGLQYFGQNNTDLLLSFHSFLIQTKKHNILVDTCCGNNKERPTRPAWHRRDGPFLQNLKLAGLTPFDIDFVLCTHLHADHVGWNTQMINGEWLPTFPNAQYLFAKKELDYWKSESEKQPSETVMYGSYDDSILPVIKSGQAVLINDDYQIGNDIQTEPAHGHTPGNIIVHVKSENDRAILCGDVIHHPLQFIKPMWSTNFCYDPELSRQTRLRILDQCAATKTAILPAHFHPPDYGYIEKEDEMYRFIT